jgi:hypothetical protein
MKLKFDRDRVIYLILAAILSSIKLLNFEDSNDYIVYREFYNSTSQYLIDGSKIEFLYYYLTSISYSIGLDFEIFYGLIVFICTYIYIYKYSQFIKILDNQILLLLFPFLYYITLFDNFSTVIFRSYIASTFLAISLIEIFKRNYGYYLVCAIFGISIQFLSIFGFLVIGLAHIQSRIVDDKSYIKYALIPIILILIAENFIDEIYMVHIYLINLFIPYYLVYNQGLDNFYAISGYFTATTITLIIFSLVIIFFNFYCKEKHYKFIYFLFTNSLILTFFIPFPKIRSRILIFILMPILISFIDILKKIGFNKIISVILVILPFIFVKYY